jgi:hypothetical protein
MVGGLTVQFDTGEITHDIPPTTGIIGTVQSLVGSRGGFHHKL